MAHFLKQIAKIFYEKYGAGINQLAFIFPNRRSGVFFRKYLSDIASKPIFSPAILTINELFAKINPKQSADNIQLLFILYDIFIQKSGSNDTFDEFAYWGEMLLNDFDDVDKYLVDARQLFTNVTDLNNIEKDYSFLQPSQIQAIRSFWSSFEPKGDTENQQFFLHIWEILYPIYEELRKRLTENGLAYEGMIYREAIEKINNDGYKLNLEYKKIVFVGLNAITKAERELLKYLKDKGVADFYWDYSSAQIKDAGNRASFFMKDNITMFPSEYEIPEEEPEDTEFELIGIPSRIGQAKQLYPILKSICDGQSMNSDSALQTAVVLPDEQLLIPVLNAIPSQIERINVTLGYSLSGTPVASLMDYLQSLQKNRRETDRATMFYHRDAIAVLRHKYVSSVCPAETVALIKEITERNQIYIPSESFRSAPLLKLLFSTPENASQISDYLIKILKELNSHLSSSSKEKDDDNDNTAINSNDLEQEFIFHYFTMVNRMSEMIKESGTEMQIETYFRLLKQLTDFIKIPFYGEPLSGLQIMGVLETRLLDFDNLIILSMNEGIFPSKNTSNSFIPYHLRRGFGLPAQEHQESIWAYHFYRMIQRAKHVIMLYDTRTDGLQSGEVSRFVHQLKYHYKIHIKQELSVYNVSSSHVVPLRAEKDEETMQALSKYEKEKSLSASAINVYLDCPLKFYFSFVKGIKEENEVSETLEYDTFGTILHRVMELAYAPLKDKQVTADILKLAAQEKNMTETIEKAFADDFFHTEKTRPLVGQTYLYGETIRKYACKVLEYDRSLTPFRYIDSEKNICKVIEINDGRRINIKGFIDRIDSIGEGIRIVDYKSGKESPLFFDAVKSLFDAEYKDRKKAIMQVFLYAWMYSDFAKNRPVQPSIYYMRNLFKPGYDPAIRQINGKEKVLVNNFEKYLNEFEDSLRNCINEMFDAGKPFIQTSNIKNCEHCPFAGICGK